MEARELRIGNWVNPIGVPVQVEGIEKYDDKEFVKIWGGEWHHLSAIDPIPLTEDWFNKFGFIKDNNGSYWVNLQTHYLSLIPSYGFWYPTYAELPEMSHEDEQMVNLNTIEFIHQLQNLYFALTGKELTLPETSKH